LVKNAFGRQAFQSVADFYQALQKGPDGTCDNPVFYVSNGPWNLYDLLCDFFQLHELPKGPVFMRDFGFLGRRLWGKPSTHKADHIRRIITAYPDLPFVLIGDSGERDTDIYMEIARSFPGRILAIFIRDVEIPGRALRISRLIESAQGEIVMHIIKNYREAALFARQLGLIEPLPPDEFT
ncbi:MAG TPA: App1 family protein, partial [Saprospiraceae bacterium]|nr:App1 family protein [Saprospiraceae bacterium]